jgi:DMSO/TMAO reductase YedYZ molybdopterin-dependent catalytic subunit
MGQRDTVAHEDDTARTSPTVRWAVGGAVYAVGVAVAGLLVGVRPLAAVAQALVEVTPGVVATAAIETLGAGAQPLLVVGVALALVACGAVAGRFWTRISALLPERFRDERVGAGVLVTTTAIAFALVGDDVPAVVVGTGLATLPVLGGRWLLGARRAGDRRAFLRRAGVAGVTLAGFGGGALAVGRLGGDSDAPVPGQAFDSAGTATAAEAQREKTETGRTVPNTATASAGGNTADGTTPAETPTATPGATETPTVTPGATETDDEGDGGMLDGAARQVPVTVTDRETDEPFGFAFEGMPPALTPVADHYVVDKQLDDPDIDADDWQLTVGLGDATDGSASYSLPDLVGHPETVREIVTLVCISNPVAGPLISTMRWRGVPLRVLLEEVGVTDDAVDVVMRAADGYTEALPWEIVREREDILLVYGMNGQTLPRKHGFPARILVPGRYGMKMAKWVDGLGAVQRDYEGYWHERGWDEEAPVQTLSAVRAVQRRGDRVAFGGIAFAGTRGIERVELSLDGGETWQEATLEEPLAENARRRWRYVADSSNERVSPGERVDVVVRATDGTGTVQTDEYSTPHPNGATGWHQPTVEL